jgi:hypothetical protein
VRRHFAIAALGCLFPACENLPDAATRHDDELLLQDLWFGETPQPTGTGSTQVTTRALYDDGAGVRQTELAGRLEIGMTDATDLRVSVPYRFLQRDEPLRDVDGFGNVVLGVLFGLPDPAGWVVSATFDVGLGNADEANGLGDGDVQFLPAFLAARRLGNSQVHGGIGGVFDGGDTDVTWFGAIVHGVDKARAILELAGSSRRGDEGVVRLTPGIAWHESDTAELSIGAPVGITDTAPDWGLLVQLSWIF